MLTWYANNSGLPCQADNGAVTVNTSSWFPSELNVRRARKSNTDRCSPLQNMLKKATHSNIFESAILIFLDVGVLYSYCCWFPSLTVISIPLCRESSSGIACELMPYPKPMPLTLFHAFRLWDRAVRLGWWRYKHYPSEPGRCWQARDRVLSLKPQSAESINRSLRCSPANSPMAPIKRCLTLIE